MKQLAVHRWPGDTPAPQDGLFAILIDTSAQRDTARQQIRHAARQVLAAVLQVESADVTIVSAPGTRPRILLSGAESRIGISISHEQGCALAAFNLDGAIGADMMRVQEIPDWQAVARDYLGPATVAVLQDAVNRPLAFTHAWTEREAALKYHGQQLSEWRTGLSGSAISLILPDAALAGHLYIN